MRHIGGLIKRLDMLNTRRMEGRIVMQGLTAPQLNALNALFEMQQEGLVPNQRMLERRLYLTNPTVTGILNRLEAKGMIARVRDEKDARSNRIVLTQAGVDCRQGVHASIDICEKRLTSVLTDEEKQQMEKLLLKMIDHMEEDKEE